jgi:hypothetical protein
MKIAADDLKKAKADTKKLALKEQVTENVGEQMKEKTRKEVKTDANVSVKSKTITKKRVTHKNIAKRNHPTGKKALKSRSKRAEDHKQSLEETSESQKMECDSTKVHSTDTMPKFEGKNEAIFNKFLRIMKFKHRKASMISLFEQELEAKYRLQL